MTKVIAFTALHYGVTYLASAIRSVIDYVDEYHIIYTPRGSYGHVTDVPCPESREELAAVAIAAAGDKLRWSEGVFNNESDHRNHVHTVAPDADVIFVVDSDEIWPDGLAQEILHVWREIGWVYVSRLRLPFMHYWRSFHKAVLNDGQLPVRVIFPKNLQSVEQDYISTRYRVSHMGYAQAPAIIEYKWRIHGHKNELRPEWFTDTFMTNRQTDCHPVSVGLWNPVDVDYRDYMPAWMSEHKYAQKDVIE